MSGDFLSTMVERLSHDVGWPALERVGELAVSNSGANSGGWRDSPLDTVILRHLRSSFRAMNKALDGWGERARNQKSSLGDDRGHFNAQYWSRRRAGVVAFQERTTTTQPRLSNPAALWCYPRIGNEMES